MSVSGAGTGGAEAIDVLIVTAVEIEYEHALLVETGAWPGSEWKRSPGPSGFGIAFRTFVARDGSPMRVAVTRAHGMGGVEAVNVALPAIAAYQPRCVAMCGVLAGRRGDVELGDVIVADRLWAYDTGKIKVEIDEAGKRTERIQGDMWQYLLDPAWKVSAERFAPEEAGAWLSTRPRSYEAQGDWVLERLVDGEDPTKRADRKVKCKDQATVFQQLWKKGIVEDGTLALTEAGRKHIGRLRILHSEGLRDAPAFKVHVGPIASGGRVVQDPQIFERLSTEMRKVIGLEMEASAIGAIGHLQGIKAIVMKAVMDFADPAKADNFKAFAARASAECLIAFLRANLEPAEPRFDDVLETGISEQPENPSPAQMLNARYRFVPFYEPGRAAIMAELTAWCRDTDAPARARLVYAAGGIGKTRLMSELCERLRGQGWNAGFLGKYAPEQRFRDLARSRRPALVVIDYAESRAILAPLMMIAAEQRRGKSESHLRVLLLARGTGDWWEELKSDTQVRDLLSEMAPEQLSPLAAEGDGRDEVFRLAAESIAAFQGREVPTAAPALGDARFNRALYVYMAALAAVEERQFTANSLMEETLLHEERFWLVQAHPSGIADKAHSAFCTAARRAATAFTLLGGERTRKGARELLTRLEGHLDEGMLSLLHALYSGAAQETGQRGYVGTLEPDLLGEAMVVRTLRKEDDGAESLLSDIFQACDESAIENGLIVLGRISLVCAAEASAWIDRVLRRDLAGRALAGLNAAKRVSETSAHATIGMVLARALERNGTKQIAEQLDAAGFPEHSVSLREPEVWVLSKRLQDLAPTDDVDELRQRSGWWNNLGIAQSELGQREAALASTTEAVDIYRKLAAARPDAFRPNLAMSLNNLGNRQSELGHHAPALASMTEAVKINRALAIAAPDAFMPDLAVSLSNLGNIQSDLGDRASALETATEAVDIYRMLAAIRADAFLPNLATSLNNLGAVQGELGQREPALASMVEAVAIRRKLATARPDVFLPDLAASLNNLGNRQSELGWREPALASTTEALDLLWPMFLSRPRVFYSTTGIKLQNVFRRLKDLGQEPTPELLARRATFESLALG
jgi:nucleoside phosphorylase/tetratricopeptide (TPR) repeat protein